MADGVRQALAAAVRERGDELVAICSRLVRVPSENPPSDTRAVAEAVGEILDRVPGIELSYPMLEKPVVNLVARIRGGRTGRRLVFNGHLDTFPAGDRQTWTVDPFGGELVGDRLYGRGVADMKGGIACHILAFMLLAGCREDWSGELVITLAGDEESMGVLGTKYLLDTVPHAAGDAMISGDIGTSKVLRFGEKGLLWFELAAEGKAGHGAHVHRGINAIDRLVAGMAKLKAALEGMPVAAPPEVAAAIAAAGQLSESLSGAGETGVLQRVTVNFGMIEGGSSPNLIPAAALTRGDIRIPAGVTLAEVEAQVQAAVGLLDGLTFRTVRSWAPNWSDPGHEIFTLAAQNCRAVWGQEVATNMRVGASDARLYRLLKNVPAVNCGLNGYNLGGPDEYIEVEDLIKLATIHTLTAYDYLRNTDK
ncbi:MAG: M20/M25/M40 family metallo-hydrolase [Sporomusaceae bacterium]|nr:M20/M25/M40 family metallo-hydrolase [Sporomusaceae bacterium]